MSDDSPVTVGGPYVENEDHVPNPSDMVAQFNTSGTGAHGKIEEVSPIFEVDKVKAAMEVKAALDPDNDAVPSSRVILPNLTDDNDTAREELLAVADARLDNEVVIGGPTPAEREAAHEGDEGTLVAVEQERSNAAGNSTGVRSAGQHTGSVSSNDGNDDTSRVGSGRSVAADANAVTSGDNGSDSGDSEDDEADDGQLKGEALEQALTDRNLSHTGKADEKRARVAEYDEDPEAYEAAHQS